MSTATQMLHPGFELAKTVQAGQIGTVGFLLVPGATAENVQNAVAPAQTGLYIARESRTAGQRIECLPPGCGCARVMVGTGGATAGAHACWAATNDGFCDAPAMANNINHTTTYGSFEQTGVAGTIVGLWFYVGGEREHA